MEREIDIEKMKEQKYKIWYCKIGEVDDKLLPEGSDQPMRKAIRKAYIELTGIEPVFIFSGWGASLDKSERNVVNDAIIQPSA